MARGTRKFSVEMNEQMRQQKPLAVGPFMGALAIAANVPASLVAEIVGLHEQTILRWFLGRSDITPMNMAKAMKILGLLAWLNDTRTQLYGTKAEKAEQLTAHFKRFKTLAGGSGKDHPRV